MQQGLQRIRIYIALPLMLCVVFVCAAQSPLDSLKIKLAAARTDTAKVTALVDMAQYSAGADSSLAAFSYARQALQLAESINNPSKIAQSKVAIGYIYLYTGKNDSAVYYVKQGIGIYEKQSQSLALIKAYKMLGDIYKDGANYPLATEAYSNALRTAQAINDSAEMQSVYYNTALLYDVNDQFELEREQCNKAIEIALAHKQYKPAVAAYTVIGSSYARQGINAPAVKAYFKALEINSKYLHNEEIQAVVDINMGNVYNQMNDSANAMKYYRESLATFTKEKNRTNAAKVLGNIGNVYMKMGDYKKAEVYELKSMDEIKQTGDKFYTALCYGNVAEFYKNTKQYDKAMEYYKAALTLQAENSDQEGIVYSMSGLGLVYEAKGDYKKALQYELEAFNTAEEIHLVGEIRDQAKELSDLYDKLHEPDKAFSYYKRYIEARDTLENKEEARKLINAELSHEYEQKQQAAKIEEAKRQAIQEEKQQHERAIRNIFVVAFIIFLFLTALLLRNLLRIRKSKQIITEQKQEVEHQKAIVEQKNKDITDSINYARRIQHAILPTAGQWNHLFRSSFIYYRPKDIVSGDFYWCLESGPDIIFAAADCTGHGVPGAFMSMLGVSSLNKIVGEKEIHAPDAILNELRSEIIRSLNPEGKLEEVKDGMDMTLCRFNKVKQTLEYAAANNSLWVVSKVNGTYELKDYDADKMPVGKYIGEERMFTLRKADVKSGDRIYIFTDGYADQFGGNKGKKFKYQHLKDVIISCQEKSMEEQRNVLEETMNEWKGSLEQVDDMLVIGIEV